MSINNVVSVIENNVKASPVVYNSVRDLAKIVIGHDWSQSVFKDNYRKEENFLETSIIALDVDKGCTLQRAGELFSKYKHLIVTTRSHQLSKSGEEPTDRFRVILFLENKITDVIVYRLTWTYLYEQFSFIDPACKDAGRFWYKGNEVISENDNGLLVPVQNFALKAQIMQQSLFMKGALSKKTQQIVKKGMDEKGARNISMFKAALDFRQNNYTEAEMLDQLSGKSTLPANEEKSALRSGYNREPLYEARTSERIPTKDWVYKWLLLNNVSFNMKTEEVAIDGRSTSFEALIATIVLDVDKQQAKYGEEKIKHALTLWKRSQSDGIVESVRKNIKFDPNVSDDSLKAFLTAVTGKEDKFNTASLKHFVWQLKRKLFNQGVVDHHLMLVVYGKTGAGKTEAIKKLLEPIDLLYRSPQDMTVINDERGVRILHDSYCIFFDEMAKANKVDVDRLKNVISTPTVTYRLMRSNSSSTVKNNAVFIGATNHTIKELIFDTTSARRFWQIDTLNKLDWDSINNLESLKIWQCVDEKSASPILSEISAMHKIQDSTFRNKSYIEEWITDFCEVISEDRGPNQWTSREKLYIDFKTWMEHQNFHHLPSISRFSSEIAKYKDHDVDGTVDCFCVNGIKFSKKRVGEGFRYNIRGKMNYTEE